MHEFEKLLGDLKDRYAFKRAAKKTELMDAYQAEFDTVSARLNQEKDGIINDYRGTLDARMLELNTLLARRTQIQNDIEQLIISFRNTVQELH